MSKFVNEYNKILLEAPFIEVEEYYTNFLDRNKEYYDKILNMCNDSIFLINHNNIELNLYCIKIDEDICFYCLDKHNKIMAASFVIKPYDSNHRILSGVWQHKSYIGLMTELFLTFVLKHYNIICDGRRSNKGYKWFDKKILKICYDQKDLYKCYVLDISKNEIINIEKFEDFDIYFSDKDKEFINFRIVIERKNG